MPGWGFKKNKKRINSREAGKKWRNLSLHVALPLWPWGEIFVWWKHRSFSGNKTQRLHLLSTLRSQRYHLVISTIPTDLQKIKTLLAIWQRNMATKANSAVGQLGHIVISVPWKWKRNKVFNRLRLRCFKVKFLMGSISVLKEILLRHYNRFYFKAFLRLALSSSLDIVTFWKVVIDLGGGLRVWTRTRLPGWFGLHLSLRPGCVSQPLCVSLCIDCLTLGEH